MLSIIDEMLIVLVWKLGKGVMRKTGGLGEGFCVSIARTNRITAEEKEHSAADRPWSVRVCVMCEL